MEEIREKIAELVYAAMIEAALAGPPFYPQGHAWVPGGNSLMQERARKAADQIALLHPPSGGGAEGQSSTASQDHAHADGVKLEGDDLCEDCPPVGYPTDKTRCKPCPRRSIRPLASLEGAQ